MGISQFIQHSIHSELLQVIFIQPFVGAQINAQANANYVHKAYSKWWLWSSGEKILTMTMYMAFLGIRTC